MNVTGMRRMATRAAVYSVALSGLLGCGHSRPAVPSAPVPVDYGPTRVVATSGVVALAAPAPTPSAQPSRQLIRRGRTGVQVTSLGTARERLENIGGALGAEVTRATVDERERAEYVLRVPPDRLEALMDSIAALGDVESRSVSAEDVTDRVIDVEARLGALRASRDRLRQLFERASTTQDVIAVERELARVQAEVESLEARLAALRGQVALSELSVALRQRPVLGPLGFVAMGIGNGVRKLFIWR
jgi:hypothetical protein